MMEHVDRNIFIILVSFLAGMALTILPLPDWASVWRPQWLFLVLVYWLLNAPYRVGLMSAWLLGLVTDILLGTALGLHAFIFTFLSYFILKFNPQLRNFPMWQQVLIIFVLSFVYLLIECIVIVLIHSQPVSWTFWLPMFSNVLFWPWIKYLLSETHSKLELS